MIVLEIAAIAIVGITLAAYIELRAIGKNARVHYKLQGLHRFK